MKRLITMIVAAGAAIVSTAVSAADMPIKAPQFFALPKIDLTNWTGFYAGVGMTGLNQGANVIGGGLASLNASGTDFDLHFGGMTVNQNYLLGFEIGGGYLANMGDTATPKSRWQGYSDFSAGGSLAGLIGTPSPTAPTTGGPFNLDNLRAVFASSMPYVHAGMMFDGKRSLSGVGLYIPLRQNLFLKAQYDYYTPGDGVQQAQGARLGVNWAF